MNSKLMKICLVFLLASCATVHQGEYGEQVSSQAEETKTDDPKSESRATNSGLVVSSKEVKGYASKHFTMIDFTFENTTSEWIEIDQIKVSYNNNKLDRLMKIPVGAKLENWIDAAKRQKSIDDYNWNLALGIATGVAAGVAGASSNSRLGGTSLALAGAGATALSYDSLTSKLDSIELSKLVPKSHLLGGKIYVPPGLHVKKWIGVYLKDPMESPFFSELKLSYRASGKGKETVIFPIRGQYSSSEFQGNYQTYHKKKRLETDAKAREEAAKGGKKKDKFNPY